MKKLKVFKPVSVDRGRPQMPDTKVYGTFDDKRLNQLAPLSTTDVQSLAFDSVPNEHAQDVMRERIALVRAMKYGA